MRDRPAPAARCRCVGRDRQERRIGLRALLAQRRQHDLHHGVEALEHLEQRRVEAAGRVAVGRRQELVLEAELIEEGAQPRIVVRAEATDTVRERVGHLRQRLAEMRRQHLLVRHVVGHLAQPVHVVGERDQPRLHLVVGEHAEGVAHHGGARDLAEGADMRQAGGAVAGLEDHLVLRLRLQPRDDLARLLERPGVRLLGEFAQRCGVWLSAVDIGSLRRADTRSRTPRRQTATDGRDQNGLIGK